MLLFWEGTEGTMAHEEQRVPQAPERHLWAP